MKLISDRTAQIFNNILMDGPKVGTHLGQWYLSISIAVYSWKLVQLKNIIFEDVN